MIGLSDTDYLSGWPRNTEQKKRERGKIEYVLTNTLHK